MPAKDRELLEKFRRQDSEIAPINDEIERLRAQQDAISEKIEMAFSNLAWEFEKGVKRLDELPERAETGAFEKRLDELHARREEAEIERISKWQDERGHCQKKRA